MKLARVKQLAGLAGGFREFVRRPVRYEDAHRAIKDRLARREERFLQATRRLIYDVPSSPYRQLLEWAGCPYGELAASTRVHGIETTLERLRDAGVHLTLDEFKSRSSICRRGLTIDTQESDFDRPGPGGRRAISGTTSGSRAKSIRVAYDWPFITEEAANELLLYTMHGLRDAPMAIWYPLPPGIAGVHNLLMNVGWGKPTEEWFSHSRPDDASTSREARLAMQFLSWSARAQGLRVPRPEFVDPMNPARVVGWLAAAQRRNGASVIRTFASSAVRIAQTAVAEGVDLRGATVFAGGEPLTEQRRRFIESAGLKVFPRYIVTETGLVAAACPHRAAADDMHLYTDRLAVIRSQPSNSYLFTTLTVHMGKVVFNTALGDFGELTVRPCGCAFGELGLNTHLSQVRSSEKITVEGMKLPAAELDAIIGSAVQQVGGGPDSYQFRVTQNGNGLSHLTVSIDPDVRDFDEPAFINALLARLERAGPGTALASHFWRQAQSVQVVREKTRATPGHKMLPVLGESDAAGPRQDW